MDKVFRLTLRAGVVVLLLLAGALIVYAVVSDTAPGASRARTVEPVPEASTGGAAAQEGPPRAKGGAVTATAKGPGAPGGKGRTGTLRRNLESELVDWRSVIRNVQLDREEAVLAGERAILKGRTYEAFQAAMELFLWPDEDGGPNVDLDKLHVTADRLQWDENEDVVRLYENVRAAGEDFRVMTDRVTCDARESTLASDAPVTIEQFRVDDAGNQVVTLRVTGVGMEAELRLKNMSTLTNGKAHLFNVSDDFLASGKQAEDAGADQAAQPAGPDAGPGSRGQEVVITCDGRITYQHVARRVTFYENARAVSQGKVLTCDQLVIVLSTTGDTEDDLEVSEVLGIGRAKLVHGDQTVRGDRLRWQNMLQAGVMTGEPAVLTTPEFEITGDELTLYRVDNRFQVKGPGTLAWDPAEEPAVTLEEVPAEVEGPQADVLQMGPPLLSNNSPVDVTWVDSMTYAKESRSAAFHGDVRVRQEGSALDCDQLKLIFAPMEDQILSVEAEGNVTAREEAKPGVRARDILCHRLVWDAVRDTVELVAQQAEEVHVKAGRHTITSSRVLLDNTRGTLECRAPGSLAMAPAEGTQQGQGITVNWQRAMHFAQTPLAVARFSGRAVADDGEQAIQGETLVIQFRQEDMEPVRIVASEKAVLDVGAGKAPDAPPGVAAAPAAAPAPVGTADGGPIVPLPGMAGSQWRLEAEELVIVPPDELITSNTPGVLTVFEAGAPSGTIIWQSEARLDMGGREVLFVGDVDADMTGSRLKCQELTLDIDEARRLRHLWAERDVYFLRRAVEPWELESDKAEAIFGPNGGLSQIIARQNVNVREGIRHLTCRVLQVFLEPDETTGEDKIQRVIAQEDVHVEYREEDGLQAGSDRLEWDAESDNYVLTGDPEAFMRQGLREVRHDTIVIGRTTRRMELPPGPRQPRWLITEPTPPRNVRKDE